MTGSIAAPKRAGDWVGLVCETTRPLENGSGRVAVGSLVLVYYAYRGFSILCKPCPHCGVALVMSKVSRGSLKPVGRAAERPEGRNPLLSYAARDQAWMDFNSGVARSKFGSDIDEGNKTPRKKASPRKKSSTSAAPRPKTRDDHGLDWSADSGSSGPFTIQRETIREVGTFYDAWFDVGRALGAPRPYYVELRTLQPPVDGSSTQTTSHWPEEVRTRLAELEQLDRSAIGDDPRSLHQARRICERFACLIAGKPFTPARPRH